MVIGRLILIQLAGTGLQLVSGMRMLLDHVLPLPVSSLPSRLLVISNAFHMPRTREIFLKAFVSCASFEHPLSLDVPPSTAGL